MAASNAMDNSLVVIDDIPGKGRGLLAGRNISGGETILCDSPLLLVVDEHAKSYCCSYCFRMSNSMAVESHRPQPQEQPELVSSLDSSKLEKQGLVNDVKRVAPECEEVSFADIGRPFRVVCKGCSEVWFCSNSCKLKACNTGHPPLVCQILSKLKDSALSSEEKNQARFLAAALSLKAGTGAAVERSDSRSISSHDDTPSRSGSYLGRSITSVFSKDPFQALLQLDGAASPPDQGSEKLYAFLRDAISAGGEGFEGLDRETVALLLSIDQRNSYGIMAPNGPGGERRLRGSGTYTKAALINHNCLPNVARFDYFDKPGASNTDVFLRALHDIPAGTEICQSYFPVSWPYEVRQERLLEEYGFTCTCQRCQTEEAWSDGEESEDGEAAGEEGNVSEGELVVVGTALSKAKAKGAGGEERSNGGSSEADAKDGEAEGKERLESEGDLVVIGTALNKGKAKVSEGENESRAGTSLEIGSDEESEDGRPSGSQTEDGGDFEHAFFFVKYLCAHEECGGTMAPLEGRWTGGQPGVGEFEQAEAMECNVCGLIRTDAEFELELAKLDEEQDAELS